MIKFEFFICIKQGYQIIHFDKILWLFINELKITVACVCVDFYWKHQTFKKYSGTLDDIFTTANISPAAKSKTMSKKGRMFNRLVRKVLKSGKV